MNRIFRTLWNDVSRSYVAVAETVRGRGKSASGICTDGATTPASRPGPTLARHRPLPLALEQRFMFDGAAAATVADAAAAAAAAEAHAAIAAVPAPVEVRAADPVKDGGKKEVVFVDTSVKDYKTLEAGIRDGVAIVEIDGAKDGLAQIAKWAESHSGYDSISILGHGSQATLNLGTTALTSASLASTTVQAELAEIGQSLTADGDLMLYGCDVAKGTDGEALVAALASATGADVAASNDATGAASKGGDWVLEASIGEIDRPSVVAADYQDLLASTATMNLADNTIDAGTIYARPNGTSNNWVFGKGWYQYTSSNPTESLTITTVALQSAALPPAGCFVQYSSDGGTSWTDLSTADVSTSGKIWRYVNNSSTTSDYQFSLSYKINSSAYVAGEQQIGSWLNVKPDTAPTDVGIAYPSGGSSSLFTDITQGTTLATLTPTDTGSVRHGYWTIESQSVANLFVLSSDNATTNVATLALGSGTVPLAGQSATITLKYYDLLQTDTADTPIAGSGISKTLTFNFAAESTQDLTDFGSDFHLNTTTSGSQSAPAVATLSNGNYVATWTSDVQGDAGFNSVIAQVFTSAGVKIGGEIIVSPQSNGALEYYPTVTALDNGRFVVAYLSNKDTDCDIAYVIVEANGTVGTERFANTAADRVEENLSVANLGNGKFVIAWNSYVADYSSGELYARTFDTTDGAPATAEVIVRGGANADPALVKIPYAPAVTALSGGSYVTTWIEYDAGWNITGVFGRIASGEVFQVTGHTDASAARIAALADGGFVTVWDHTDSGNRDVYFQRFDSAGVTQGTATVVNTATAGTQALPTVAALSGGGFIVGWESDTGDYSGSGVFGRRFGADGSAVDVTDFEINQHRRNGQGSLALAAGPGERFIAAWADGAADGASNSGVEARIYTPAVVGPKVTLGVSTSSSAEAAGTSTVTATLSAAATIDTVITLSASGTASGSSIDYTLSSNTITILAGQTTGTATITAAQDTLDESDETVIIDIASVSGGDGASESGTQQATVTITDDDAAPSISIANTSVAEGNSGTSTMIFTASLSAASGQTVSVNYATSDDGATAGSDYAAASGALVFAPGETSKTFTVTVNGDSTAEASEILLASLSAPSNVTLGTASATGTITNDDAPAAPSAPDLATASDSGSLNADDITNDTTPTISGTAEAGSTVKLYDTDGSTLLGTATADSLGKWSVTSSALSAGLHTLTARASDAAGNTSAASASLSVTIDTTAPSASLALDLATASDSGSSSSDNVTSAATPTITGNAEAGSTVTLYDTDGITVLGTPTTADGSGNWSITSSTLSTGVHTLSAKATDAAGNVSVASAGLAITIDTGAPTASLGAATIAIGSAVTSGRSSETGTVYLVLDGTSVSDLASLDAAVAANTAAKATVVAADSDTSIATGGLAVGSYHGYSVDAAGNVSAVSANAVTLANGPSNTVATVLLSVDSGTDGDLITHTAAQTISGTLSAVTVAGETVEVSLDNGSHWRSAGNTVGTNSWSLAGVTLAASNTLMARVTNAVGSGATLSRAYVLDTVAPSATIVVSDSALAIGETSLVTITFSEAVSDFDNSDLAVANGTLSTVGSSDGGFTWMGTFTPTAGISDASNVITLANTGVSDAAGNAGAGATTSNNYTIDAQRPNATIVVADSALAAGETSQVTITFSEAVSGFDNSDLTIQNGSLSAVSSSDGGITWSATFTPNLSVSDASNLIVLDNTGVTDLSGNAGSGTTSSNNYVVATVRPTATIVVADNALAIGQTSLVTIVFSEAVGGFSNDDLTVANGTLSPVSSSDGGITWTATLTPSANVADSSNAITLNNAGVFGSSGNSGSATTTSNDYAIDTARPTATIVLDKPSLAAGETATVTITFSEAVSGFSDANLTVANGSLSGLTSSDNVTWTATFTPAADLTDASNVITLNQSSVQDGAGNSGSGSATSANYAVLTARTLSYSATTFAEAAANDGSVTSTLTITLANATFSGADGEALGTVSNVPAGLTAHLVRVDATHATLSLSGKASAHANAQDLSHLTVSFADGDFASSPAASIAGATTTLAIDFADPAAAPVVTPVTPVTPATPAPAVEAVVAPPVVVPPPVVVLPPAAVTPPASLTPATPQATPTPEPVGETVHFIAPVSPLTLAASPVAESSLASLAAPQLVAATPATPAPALAPTEPARAPASAAAAAQADAARAPATAGVAESGTPLLTQGGGFQVVVSSTGAATGDSLVVNRGIADQAVASGTASRFAIPADAFAAGSAGAVVTLSARQSDGRPLPAWVRFDAASGKFDGQPPPGYAGEVSIRVTARDAQGHEAVVTFKVKVGEKSNRDGQRAQPERPGRASLSDQLRLAARPHPALERLARITALRDAA